MLPDGFTPCVWMSAGLIAYKLCDRSFDCDHCPLDRALRGETGEPLPVRTDLSPRPATLEFKRDRRYHHCHAWAQARGPDSFRMGIDTMAASLLPPVHGVILPARGGALRQGRAGCWLDDEAGPIPLNMPLSGTVIRSNQRLRTHPGALLDAPYETGWLLELRCPEPSEELARLISAEAMRLQAQSDLRKLHRRLALLLRRESVATGTTLADGGQPVADLRRALGASRYRRLILEFLR